MPNAVKVHDLRRDPRCCIITPLADKDDLEGEAKLFCRAREISTAEEHESVRQGFKALRDFDMGEWDGSGHVFEMGIEGGAFQRRRRRRLPHDVLDAGRRPARARPHRPAGESVELHDLSRVYGPGDARDRRLGPRTPAGGARTGRPPGPTTDRVREATFNALGSLGAVEGATVLDLFAGSGALGIEALSRGADALHLRGRGPRRPAGRGGQPGHLRPLEPGRRWSPPPPSATWPTWPAPAPASTSPSSTRPTASTAGTALMAALPADLAVLESGRRAGPAAGLGRLRSKRYGRTHVTILERSGLGQM